MAKPLQSGKQSVNLATSGPRVSRIRRDPPPKVVEKEVDVDAVDREDVIVGVLAFTLALFVIILAVGSDAGWSLRQYTLDLSETE